MKMEQGEQIHAAVTGATSFLGAALVAVGVVYGHTPNLFGGDLAGSVVAAGASRCNLSFSEGLVRGVLCNILVCIAVWMSFGAKNISGKLMASFWPIMLFVLCGFEHSVADMYFAAVNCSGSNRLPKQMAIMDTSVLVENVRSCAKKETPNGDKPAKGMARANKKPIPH